MNFIQRLGLGFVYLFSPVVKTLGWVFWIFTNKDFTQEFMSYKNELTKKAFSKNGK